MTLLLIDGLSHRSSKDQAEMDPADMEDVEEVEEEETGEDVNSKGWSWYRYDVEMTFNTCECDDEGDIKVLVNT